MSYFQCFSVTVSAIYCFNPKLRLCFVRNWVLLYINKNENRCAKLIRSSYYTFTCLCLSFRRLVQNEQIVKVARYSFSGSIPPKFEHKVRRHKQSFGKIATTVVLDKDENLLWSGLQRHRSCHSNEMTLLPILLAAVYLGTGNCSSKIVHGSFFLQ